MTYSGIATEWPPGLYVNKAGSIRIIITGSDNGYLAAVMDYKFSWFDATIPCSYEYYRIGDL